MGFAEPTPIQLRAFPIILAGKDLDRHRPNRHRQDRCFRACRSSRCSRQHGNFRCLVLEPTRELAAQVETAFRDYGRFTDLRATVVHGGVGYGKQREDSNSGVDVLSPRRADCSIISSRTPCIFATLRFSCSMKSIACSTWAFCPMCDGSSKKFRRSADAAFFRDAAAGDRAAGRLGAARTRVGGNRRAPCAGGNRYPCRLSGRGRTKIRSAHGFARAHQLR